MKYLLTIGLLFIALIARSQVFADPGHPVINIVDDESGDAFYVQAGDMLNGDVNDSGWLHSNFVGCKPNSPTIGTLFTTGSGGTPPSCAGFSASVYTYYLKTNGGSLVQNTEIDFIRTEGNLTTPDALDQGFVISSNVPNGHIFQEWRGLATNYTEQSFIGPVCAPSTCSELSLGTVRINKISASDLEFGTNINTINSWCDDDNVNVGSLESYVNIPGGVFTLDGNLITQFNPLSLGAGNFILRYTLSGDNKLVSDRRTTATIFIEETIVVSNISTADFSVSTGSNCVSDGSFNLYSLTSKTSGLIFSSSSPGFASPSTFNPANGSIGNNVITATSIVGNCEVVKSISINVVAVPSVNAGSDESACEGENVVLTGFSPSSGGTWTALDGGSISGTTFITTSLNPGSYSLRYTIIDGPCSASDIKTVIIGEEPTVTVNNDLIVCEGEIITALATIGGSASSVSWSTSGSGSFADPNALSSEYIPGNQDIGATVTITTETNDPVGACTSTSASFNLTIVENPNVNAGIDENVCEGENVVLTGFSPVSGGIWTALDGGFISGTTFITTSLNPGNYSLRYDVNENGCSASDIKVITINESPGLVVKEDFLVCESEEIEVSVTLLGSASSVIWSTDGEGSFDSSNELVTIYRPEGNDIGSVVNLTATSNIPNASCSAVSESIEVEIGGLAIVNAGNNQVLCIAEPVNLSGSISGSASSGTWSSSGTGSFSDVNDLNAVYTLSTADINNGGVTLVLTTDDPAGNCGVETDEMEIIIGSEEPELELSSTDIEIGDFVRFSSGIEAASYLWEFGDGNISTQADPIHYYFINGVYDVRLTLTISSTCEIIYNYPELITVMGELDIITNIDEELSEAIKVSPNPFKDFLRIDSNEIEHIEIIAATGRNVTDQLNISNLNDETQISFKDNLPSGLYIMSLQVNGKTNKIKIIKK
ncbi:MAG: PKD domain-containing protein [Bacteroidota bacterium]